ncbi:hypothetical protein GCM10009592_28540 [Brachybacterium rhamnosum]|uniref:Uncharacterized protein n=1 Tax=Brachybacterium rhamnosum TaxID=173361 RepID=A0ABW4Q3W3_9MICO
MGYKEWRERQNARIDAMNARADARVERAKQREAEVRAEVEASKVQRAADQVDPALAWFRARAASLGEDHEDLVARAAVVGVGDAPLPKRRRGEVFLGVGALLSMDDSLPVQRSERIDGYENWRDRINIAERLHAKVAEGVPLSKGDRVMAKMAGVPLP